MRYLPGLFSIVLIIGCSSNPTQIVRHKPVIHSISAARAIIFVAETVEVQASVSDEDENDELRFNWSATGGTFINTFNNPTQWRAPNAIGTFTLTLSVSDGYFQISKSIQITVKTRGLHN